MSLLLALRTTVATAPPQFFGYGGPAPRDDSKKAELQRKRKEEQERVKETATKLVVAQAEKTLFEAKARLGKAQSDLARQRAIAETLDELNATAARIEALDRQSAEIAENAKRVSAMIAAYVAEMEAEADDEEFLLLAA